MSADLYLTGDAGADTFNLVRSGSSDLIYQNQPETGTPTYTVSLSSLGAIYIFGNGGADVVNLDYSGGDPIPNSLDFAAGGGTVHSTINITGVAAGTGYAPDYTLSTGELIIANSALTDTIEFANVDTLNLFDPDGGSLTVAGGPATFNQDLGAAGGPVDVTVDSGASLAFGVTQHLDNLTVDSGGTASMLAAGGQVLDTNTLTVGGVLDLANNDLLVNTPDSTDIATLQEQVAAGVVDAASSSGIGTTQGLIYSSTAATDGMTIGVAPESDVSLGTIDGQSIPATALIARYTLAGDVNLDGLINGTDASIVSTHLNTHPGTTPPKWYLGDVNYDGYVNGSDSAYVSANFNSLAVPFPTDVTVGDAYTLTFPSTPDGTTATRWDINWGDGTVNSYGEGTASASHVFTTTGSDLVQFDAVTYDSSAGYGTYYGTAQTLVITAAGVTATPLNFLTMTSTDTYTVSADGSGDTIITQNGTTVEDEPTADILALSFVGGAANVSIDFTNGDPLPASGIFSDAANITLTGPHGSDSLITTGTVAILGNDTIRYPATTTLTDSLTSAAGIFALAGSVTLSSVPSTSDVTVATNATVLFNGSQTLNSLTIEPGGTAREISGDTTLGDTVLTIGTLDIQAADSQGDNGGVLDLGYGDMIVQNTSTASIQGWLAAGFDGGLWDAIGDGIQEPASIISSGAANDPYQIESLGYTSVGTAPGCLNINQYDGQGVSTGSTVIALTYYGDANLDRVVDDVDSSMIQLSSSNQSSVAGWTTGDFNYDGVVDQEDLNLSGESTPWIPAVATTTKVSYGKIALTGVGLLVKPNGAPPIRIAGSLTNPLGNKISVALPKSWTNVPNGRIVKTLATAFQNFTGMTVAQFQMLSASDGNLVIGSVDSYVTAEVQVIWVDSNGVYQTTTETVEVDLATASPLGEQPWQIPANYQAMQTQIATMIAGLNLNGVQLSGQIGAAGVNQWQQSH